MRWIHWATLTVLLAMRLATAGAAPPSPPAQPVVKDAPTVLPADAPVDAVLDALDQRGKTLRDFTAKLSLTRIDPNLGNSSTKKGQVVLQKTSPDDARLHVVLLNAGHVTQDERHEYLLDNGWLTERDYRVPSETKKQILKPGQKMNLMKLGEGPFPLPIGQDKADVHRMFDVKKERPAGDDPANTIHIVLSPKAETHLARKFKQIDVFVDRTSHMPVRVDTVDPRDTEEEQTVLENVRVNVPGGLTDADFKLPEIDQTKWSLRTEPYSD